MKKDTLTGLMPGELEVGEKKTVYEGTLTQLYNNDSTSAQQSQDVALLDKLDKKLRSY